MAVHHWMLSQVSLILQSPGVHKLCMLTQENHQKVALFIEKKQLYYSGSFHQGFKKLNPLGAFDSSK